MHAIGRLFLFCLCQRSPQAFSLSVVPLLVSQPPWPTHRTLPLPSLPHSGHSWMGGLAAQATPAGQPTPAVPPADSASCPVEPAPASTVGDSVPEGQPAQPAAALLTPQQGEELQDCKAAALAWWPPRRNLRPSLHKGTAQKPTAVIGASWIQPRPAYGPPITSARPLPTDACPRAARAHRPLHASDACHGPGVASFACLGRQGASHLPTHRPT